MIYERKKKINNMINKIKDKNILKEIFNLAQSELNKNGECRYTCNNNGIFFDLNLLSDEILLKIETLLISNVIDTESDTIKFTSYSLEDTEDTNNMSDIKLSNKEKTFKNNYIKDK